MKTQTEAITQERLRQLFTYCDGALLNNVVRRNKANIGLPAGYKTKRGYTNIRIGSRIYKAHRLIFMHQHGFMPQVVDHIDGDTSNNRIENLRACSTSQNGMNRSGSYAKTGHRNVYARGSKFQVHMKHEGQGHYIGTFDCIHEAATAAADARQKLFGEFA